MNKGVYIIAEAGVNHNGSLDMAIELVAAAARAGADAVKFQSFKADRMVTRIAGKAHYQRATTDPGESQHAMIRRLELSEANHVTLAGHCADQGIEFLSTPFDHESLQLLDSGLNIRRIKLSSGDINNAPLLLAAASCSKPLILSTGMSTLGDIEAALGILAFGYSDKQGDRPGLAAFSKAYASIKNREVLRKMITLLHCTTEYPTPFSEVNLRAMQTMANAFLVPVGYSDHTTGITVPVAAVALGASVIEKHFTLNRGLPGPDHRASLEPEELTQMVCAIRETEAAMGSSVKHVTTSEAPNLTVARKSLIAEVAIRKGDPFTHENLGVKRPGDGVSPTRYWEYIGKVATRDYLPDERVDE